MNTSARRRGISLIEAVVVMSIVSVIATMSATLLGAMMRQQAAASRELAIGNSVIRLAERFRSDIHATADAVVSDRELTLRNDEGSTVTWLHQDEWIVRRVIGDDGETRNDYYDIAPEWAPTFFRQSLELPDAVQFVGIKLGATESPGLESKSPDPRFKMTLQGMQISAELDRSHRWSSTVTSEEATRE